MKKLDLDTYGVNEMDAQEVLMFDGGSLWDTVKAIANAIGGGEGAGLEGGLWWVSIL